MITCEGSGSTDFSIQPGDAVLVLSMFGDWLERRAVSSVQKGQDFMVIWVCTEDEWNQTAEANESVATPWPAEAVRPR